MYSNYTPLQYIEPATITTVPTSTVMQSPKPVENVQYNSPPKCVLTPRTPSNSPAMSMTQNFSTRSKAETTNVGVLDQGWSDTNEIRVNENVNSITFEFVESTINLKTRSNIIKKSDEIVKFYETPQQAKKAIDFLIQKLNNIPNVIYDIKPRNSDDAYARLLINYLTDNADGFFTFNGYITIYSESDDTLDKITHLLENELKRLSVPQTPMQSPVQSMNQGMLQNSGQPMIQSPGQNPAQVMMQSPVQNQGQAMIQSPGQNQGIYMTRNSTPYQPAMIQTTPMTTPNNTPQLGYNNPVNYNTKFSPRAYLSDYQ